MATTLSYCGTIRSSKLSSAKIRDVKTNRSPAAPPSIDFSMPSHDAKPRNPSKSVKSFRSAPQSGRTHASARLDITIVVRGDAGVAGPEMYDFCEAEGIFYAFGYGTNATLKHRISELELVENTKLFWWMNGCRPLQRFHVFEDYRANSWPHARRIVTKVEMTQLGSINVRYVVTNMSGDAGGIYRGFYVQRGNVPERPIGELKNGLQMDRLSSHRFLENGHKLMTHMLA